VLHLKKAERKISGMANLEGKRHPHPVRAEGKEGLVDLYEKGMEGEKRRGEKKKRVGSRLPEKGHINFLIRRGKKALAIARESEERETKKVVEHGGKERPRTARGKSGPTRAFGKREGRSVGGQLHKKKRPSEI